MSAFNISENVQVQEGVATTTYSSDSLTDLLETVVLDNNGLPMEWANLKLDERQRNRTTGRHLWVMTVMR